jgi:hypothetical protein
MTADDFRRLALDMQGAVEGAHMGHPDFRANGRIFASLHTRDRLGMVKLTPDEQRVVMRAHPGMFEPSAGAWGRQGCTNVILSAADAPAVRGAMLLAWQAAVSQGPPRGRSRKNVKGKAGRTRRR